MKEGSSSSSPFSGELSTNAGCPASATLPAFLTGNLQRASLMQSLYSANPAAGSPLLGSPRTVSHMNALAFGSVASDVDGLSAFQQTNSQLEGSSCSADHHRWPRLDDSRSGKLKFPKIEPVDDDEDRNTTPPPGFTTDRSFMICSSSFLRLPDLVSVEQIPDDFRRFSTVKSATTPNYHFSHLALPSSSSSSLPTAQQQQQHLCFPPSVHPRCTLSRQRRKKISDRTRQLEKLMPWERKMDIATMLEEAHKYITFLQAQISVLQSMPRDSNFASLVSVAAASGGRGGGPFQGGVASLEKLNRQQLLQVMLNSAVVQEKLYSSGCCVFSVEQMLVLMKMAERKTMMMLQD